MAVRRPVAGPRLRSVDAALAPVGLLSARAAIAVGLLAAPVAALRALGTDTATARRVTWLTRMLAVRDGAIAVGGLLARRRGSPAPWLLAGAVSDAVDAAAFAAALRQGRLHGAVPIVLVPIAATSAAAGAASALRCLS